MTTESKADTDQPAYLAKPFAEWTAAETAAERRRNSEHCQQHFEAYREQFPKHWLIIYDGGDSVISFTEQAAFHRHRRSLSKRQRRTACYFLPPRSARFTPYRRLSARRNEEGPGLVRVGVQ